MIDLARFLVGEIATVSGLVRTFVARRQVDDALEVAVEFAAGAVGTIEATRLALGRRNAFQWEINGSDGLALLRHGADERAPGLPQRRRPCARLPHGPRDRDGSPVHAALVAARPHRRLGDTFVHEAHHLLQAIATDGDVAPYGATFEDGYRASEIADAIVRSSESGRRETVEF